MSLRGSKEWVGVGIESMHLGPWNQNKGFGFYFE